MTPRFRQVITTYGTQLGNDLGVTTIQAASILGNGWGESKFQAVNEAKPLVKGSRGGFGWFQWTGPRRKEFESWCYENSFDLKSDEANYGFMVHELLTSERAALSALKKCKTVEAAARCFCTKYERAGIPHMEGRIAAAQEAYGVLQPLYVKAVHAATQAVYDGTAPVFSTDAAPLVQPAGAPQPHGMFAKLKAVFGHTHSDTKVPVMAGTRGDPTLFYVQTMLKQRAYYNTGSADGLDGPLTRDAVAAIRKDNGMGDGGIDTEFLTRLPTFGQRPVSEARANISIGGAMRHAPDLFAPIKNLLGVGGVTGVLGAAGATTSGNSGGTGLFDRLGSAADKANTTLTTVQTGLDTAGTMVAWVTSHWWLILLGVCTFAAFKAFMFGLDVWIKVKQARA